MKVLGVIPARYASTRFPGKPLIDLNGKTMIQRVYEGAKKSQRINELIVATDDQRVFDEVKRFGGEVVMTGSDHQSGTDRCAEVASLFDDIDVVINIQGDEPLVDFRQLDQLIDVFANTDTQIATLGNHSISPEDIENPNRIKIIINSKNQAMYFSRSGIPNSFHFSGDPLQKYPYLRHIGLYAYRKSILNELSALKPVPLELIESLEQLRWLYYGYPIQVVITDLETPNIDTPDDVEKVLAFL